MEDGSLMDRFERNAERYRARDAIITVFVAGLLLVLVSGAAVTRAGEQEPNKVEREVMLAVGKPTGWIADQLPLATAAEKLTAALSPDAELAESGGFDAPPTGPSANATEIPVVTKDAFDPLAIGAPAPPKKPLKKLLVTGDSLSMPLDTELARTLSDSGVKVVKDPHLGTGISKTDLLDWGKLAVTQTKKEKPDAVVVFIGANEGFPLPDLDGKQVECCGVDWAASYANRARQLMNTYRQDGKTRVYWISVPTPRDPKRIRIQRVVNAGIAVAAQPYRSQVSLVDTVTVFTPGGKYRDAMDINGRRTLVRESDGIHLNKAGSMHLRDIVLDRLGQHFTFSR